MCGWNNCFPQSIISVLIILIYKNKLLLHILVGQLPDIFYSMFLNCSLVTTDTEKFEGREEREERERESGSVCVREREREEKYKI
jgi:hypothetical protein